MLHKDFFQDNKLILSEDTKLDFIPKHRFSNCLEKSIEKVNEIIKILRLKPIDLNVTKKPKKKISVKKLKTKSSSLKLNTSGISFRPSSPTKTIRDGEEKIKINKISINKSNNYNNVNNPNNVNSSNNIHTLRNINSLNSKKVKIREDNNSFLNLYTSANTNNLTEISEMKPTKPTIHTKHTKTKETPYEDDSNLHFNSKLNLIKVSVLKPSLSRMYLLNPKKSNKINLKLSDINVGNYDHLNEINVNNNNILNQETYSIDDNNLTNNNSTDNNLNSIEVINNEFNKLERSINNINKMNNTRNLNKNISSPDSPNTSNKRKFNLLPPINLNSVNYHKKTMSIQNEYLPLMERKYKDLDQSYKKSKKFIKIIKSIKSPLRRNEQSNNDIKTGKTRSLNQKSLKKLITNTEPFDYKDENGVYPYIDYTNTEEVKDSINLERVKKDVSIFIRGKDNKARFVSPIKRSLENKEINNVYIQSNNFEKINSEGVFKFKDVMYDKYMVEYTEFLKLPKNKNKIRSLKELFENKSDRKRLLIENLAVNNRKKFDNMLKKIN